ncbi:MAG: 1,4-beta-glucanase [Ruminococcus sp.]|nr:1,4-beta-glucanase [Ruminococcus sp.]
MKLLTRTLAGLFAVCIGTAAVPFHGTFNSQENTAYAASGDIRTDMKWGTLKIGGAGFVSGIVSGQKEMYLRTDVGGAYKYNYKTNQWDQLFGFLTESDRGLLSVKGIAIDPTDDDTVYFLCGCAYFSNAKTVIFKTTDGGKTFTESDVTDLIQVHGNGDGRECIEPIAIDPDNTDTIYAGGDVTAGSSALIKSTDGGKTWKPVDGYDSLGLFSGELKYPMWTDHMVRGTEPSKEYNQQNGIGCILIEDGKVYVGTSVTGQANIHVASVKDDKFTPLSADLPTANYPCSITSDNNGNVFFTYIAGLAFSGTAGGAFKYDTASGTVTDISPCGNAIGMIEADEKNPDKLLARTCGVWSDQWYEKEWTDTSIAWGDHFYRSEDGGKTWQDITPGQQFGQYTDNHYFISNPMSTGGYDWVYGKACHWGSSIILDPRNPDRIVLTSGNGVFACDNVWDERDIQFYFQPDGVEEVVCLDFVSVPGGAAYSAIGDYDGFIHNDTTSIPPQYKPNMGSTSAIAYCPQDPEVMIRIAEGDGNNSSTKGYYTLDAGKTWEPMSPSSGGKAAIVKLGEGKYRFIKSGKESASISYSDDFGQTWTAGPSINSKKVTHFLVDPVNPLLVYASAVTYNEYWASDTSKKEPTFDECHYSMLVSTDGGKTWEDNPICKYDMCDHTGDPAYIKEDTVAMAAGWNGLYILTDQGKTATKTDVFYAKTVGYGAPEKKGTANTLFMYGKPEESDPEGIYRSTDEGKTWILINTDNIYGGTGNGNFLVGDMNEFGKVYMSTVGCGIVYGELSDGETPEPDPIPEADYGDANCDGTVNLSDAILVLQVIGNPDAYGISGSDKSAITEQGAINGDVANVGDGLTNSDALAIQEYLLKLVDKLPKT